MMDKPMTKRRFEQYITLRREITMLEKQIRNAEIYRGIVTDTVRGSSTSIPYQQHDIVITGYDSVDVPRLRARKAAHETECSAVKAYIEAVEDSIMRQILALRYIEGKTLGDVAQLVGYSESRVKQLQKAFFENIIPNCPQLS